MKKIQSIIFLLPLLFLASCMGIDNWDEPDAHFYGTITDSYTGKNLLASQDEWKIRIWERSWEGGTPNHQEIPIKQDGTYNNTKLFAGTYDVLPYGGPFWPCDTAKNVVLDKSKEVNFTVIPYLQILDFDAKLSGTSLTLSCRLKAPRRDGLPNLREVKAFISLTTFCGNGSNGSIGINEYNDKRIQINKSWASEVGDSDTSKTYSIGPLPVKSGYTYYVRIGASVNDANQKYNYSDIVKIVVP